MKRELIDRILLLAAAVAVPGLGSAQNAVPGNPAAVPPTGSQVGVRVTADSVRPYLVFAPARESWFVVASRGKRMLLDIGRVDLEVRKDTAVAQAFREAAAALSRVPVGASFVVRGPWGTERVRTTAIDSWNGRIVLVVSGSPAMDSAAAGKDPVTASAFRVPAGREASSAGDAGDAGVVPPLSMTASGAAPCARTPLSGPLALRVKELRDSLERILRALPPPPYERLARRVTTSSSHVVGCFGAARVALAVSLRAGASEWVRERIVLVDPLGHAQVVAVEDLRFKVHDLLHAVDVDGDGTDDIAAVGRAHQAGGTTLLRYDPRTKKLVRLAVGFVWENL